MNPSVNIARKRRANKRMGQYRYSRSKFQFRRLRRALRKASEAIEHYNILSALVHKDVHGQKEFTNA